MPLIWCCLILLSFRKEEPHHFVLRDVVTYMPRAVSITGIYLFAAWHFNFVFASAW